MSATPVSVTVRGTITAPPATALDRILSLDPAIVFTGRGVLPAVTSTATEPQGWSRIGATRTVTFSDGGTAREEITDLQPGRRYAYRATGFTNVLNALASEMRSEWRVAAVTPTVTAVDWTVEFDPRPYRRGIVHQLFAPAWRRYMGDILGRVLASIGERSTVVDE